MPVVPHATKQDFETAFRGFAFPISKSGILGMARDKGGVDREVARVLTQIPDRRYRNLDEVKESVRDVYRRLGVADDALPL